MTITPTTADRAYRGAVAFAPEDAVKGILNEVQEDMSALAEDARTLRFNRAQYSSCGATIATIGISAGIFNVAGISNRKLVNHAAAMTPPTFSTPLQRPSPPAPAPEISTLAEFQESMEMRGFE